MYSEFPEIFREKGKGEIIYVLVVAKSTNYETNANDGVLDLFYEPKSSNGSCAVDGAECRIVDPIKIKNYVNPWDLK